MSQLWTLADESQSMCQSQEVEGLSASRVPISITGPDEHVSSKGDLVSLIVEKLAQHERRVFDLLQSNSQRMLDAVNGLESTKAAAGGKSSLNPPVHAAERLKGTRKTQDAFVAPETTPDGSDAGAQHRDGGFSAANSVGSSARVPWRGKQIVANPFGGRMRSKLDVPGAHRDVHFTPSTPPGGKADVLRTPASRVSSPGGSDYMGWQETATDTRRFSVESLKSQHEEFYAHLQIHEAAVLSHSFHPLAGKLIKHPAFEYCVCALVALNAVCIGVHADWGMKNFRSWGDEPEIFQVLDRLFACVFAIELLLRIAGEGRHFVARKNRNFLWNVLDTFLVLFVALEEILRLFFVSAPSVTNLRLLRSLRTVRAVRIFRITRFFTDMRLLVMGLMCAARSLFWVIVLLLFVMYIFAVGLMEITAEDIASQGGLPDDNAIFTYIGSLEVTIYTLFKSISGGLEWGIVVDQLAKRGPVPGFLYSLYIVFTTLCILNIVTGVFVQNANSIAQNDQIEMGLEHLERRQIWLNEVVELFKLADAQGAGQGRIDWAGFKACITDPSVQACFTKLGIDLESVNARGLFCLFDFNNDGTIDMEEFARGVMKMHGHARSLDLHLVSEDSKRILQYVRALIRTANSAA